MMRKWTPIIVAGVLLFSIYFYLHNYNTLIDSILAVVLVIFSIPIWIEIIISVFHKKFGVDLIAGLALLTSVIFSQYLAGMIILLMLSGGEALESYAMFRARKSLSELLKLMPDKAHVKMDNGIMDIDSHEVVVGAQIIVKAGEVIPVDGIVIGGESAVDESIMTGESMPALKKKGYHVLAGTINTGAILEIKAVKALSDSRFESIIAMVRKAEENKAPFVRLADSYSGYFTIFTLIVAGIAYAISGELMRILAVLVVATPCPLIIATPIAFMSGMNLASKKGIIVKNGGALEALDKVKTFVFDKTGTITLGTPKIHAVHALSPLSEKEILYKSASLDQLSVHVLARALMDYMHKIGAGMLSYPENFKEIFGEGVSGKIDGSNYIFGKLSFIRKMGIKISEDIISSYDSDISEGIIPVYLAKESGILGVVLFRDEVRPEIKNLFSNLNKSGISRMVLLSGDKERIAKQVAESVGISEYKSEYLPDQKLDFIKEVQEKDKEAVAMIGDGVNDAPALMQADAGIALGTHGATAASDSADIVIISGHISLVYDAYLIARRSLRVARESIWIGLGLSGIIMIVALGGYVPPVYGALIQEIIDIAVILYALRAGISIRKNY